MGENLDDTMLDLLSDEEKEINDVDYFLNATDYVRKNNSKISKQDLLTLYGYYKQATEGSCNISKPFFFDLKSKEKWTAWNCLQLMPEEKAKKLYVKKVASIDPQFSSAKNDEVKNNWVCFSTLNGKAMEGEESKNIVDYIGENNVDKVKELIIMSEGKNNSFVDKLDGEGLGLVHWAADRGSSDILRLLFINFNANLNLEDVDGQTALHYATSCGHYECVKYLLSNGVQIDKRDVNGIDALSLADDEKIKQLFLNYFD